MTKLTPTQLSELDALLIILYGVQGPGRPAEYDRARDEVVAWIQEQIDKGPASTNRVPA